MQRTTRPTATPSNKPAAPQGNRTVSGQARTASTSSPTSRAPATPSTGAGTPTEGPSQRAITCRKCKSTQIVANKRGYSFANMFKTLGTMILIGLLSIVFTSFNLWYGLISSSSVIGAVGVIGMILLFLSLPVSILVGFVGRSELVNGCMNCGFKWRPALKK